MPLAYDVEKPLTIPADQFNAHGLVVLIAHGARYSGRWKIAVFPADDTSIPLGRILAAPDDRPDITAHAWITDACAEGGLTIVQSENFYDLFSDDQRLYFSLSRYIIGRVPR